MHAHHNNRGFTLIETIIYVGLFGIMFSGIFVSIYPFFTGAERLSRNIATEGEVAFILAKIHYALAEGITEPAHEVDIPAEYDTDNNNPVLSIDGDHDFEFALAPCASPLTCSQLTLSVDGATPLPLSAERVSIEDFNVNHYGPNGDEPRYLEVTFTANGVPVGPVTYYLHF